MSAIRLFFILVALLFSFSAFAQRGVIVILSEADSLPLKNNKVFSTGHYLNEFAIPLMAMIDLGLTPQFFTPTGKLPHLDKDSIDLKLFHQDQKSFERAQNLFRSIGTESAKLRPMKDLAQVDLSQVSVVFVPGGHAPMVDLLVNEELGKFLKRAHEHKVTTALICHGPIALISTLEDPQSFVSLLKEGNTEAARKLADKWPYAGYAMTIFSNEEEKVAEKAKLKGEMFFAPADAFRAAGGNVTSGKPFTSQVVVDRELITGQNPKSVDEFTQKVSTKIKARVN